MNFAEAEPNATTVPMVNGSTSMAAIAAFDAMKRFDGPAKGIMFKRKDVTRMLRTSKIGSSQERLETFVSESR
jgi:hypothetical protein